MLAFAICCLLMSLLGAVLGILLGASERGYTRRQRRNLRAMRADISPALNRGANARK